MRSWWKAAIRLFGILNILFASLGLVLLIGGFLEPSVRSQKVGDPRYYVEAYYAYTGINFLFLLLLIVAGIFLWRLQNRGRVLSNLLFCLLIIYWVASSALGLFLSMSPREGAVRIGSSMAAAAGTGNMGIAPLLMPGYPLIGLVVINLAYRRLRRHEASTARLP